MSLFKFLIVKCDDNLKVFHLADTDPSTGNVKTIDRLHAGLFLNYNKNIQPQFEGVPTPVGLGVTITYLDVEEMSGKLNVHCWQNIVRFHKLKFY